MKRKFLCGVALLFVTSTACSPASKTVAEPPQVPAATVQRATFQQQISSSGNVLSPAQVNVQPQASGRVKQVQVDIGQQVHAGDVVAQLENDASRIAVLQAQANLDAAQAKLQTIQAGARPDDVEQAHEALAQQQARLAGMEAQGRPEDVAAAQ